MCAGVVQHRARAWLPQARVFQLLSKKDVEQWQQNLKASEVVELYGLVSYSEQGTEIYILKRQCAKAKCKGKQYWIVETVSDESEVTVTGRGGNSKQKQSDENNREEHTVWRGGGAGDGIQRSGMTIMGCGDDQKH